MNDALLLFAENALKLETSSFWKWATSKGQNPDMEKITAGDWLAHEGLNKESLDAFCLTLRLLIQDQDGFSIRQINLYSKEWNDKYSLYRDEISKARENLLTRLSEPSMVRIPGIEKTTNEDIFKVIFYGGLAHSNPEKRDMFKQLVNSGLFSFFVFRTFIGILFHYRNCIQTVAYNTVQYLREEKLIPWPTAAAK